MALLTLSSVAAAGCGDEDIVTGPPIVEPETPLAALGIEPSAAVIKSGERIQFRALGSMAQGAPALFAFTWTSSNPEVAEVSPLGLLISKAVGSTVVTVTIAGQSAKANVVVTSNVPGEGTGQGRPRPQ
jgi:hypothetical protein